MLGLFMTHSYLVYIDESGDDGLDPSLYRVPGKRGGQSCWLVISACVIRLSREREPVQWRDEILARINRAGKSNLHFANLDHAQKVTVAKTLSQKPLIGINVLSHKVTIAPNTYREKNQLYFYVTRYLIERISWFCRDMRKNVEDGNGAARITFSRRGGMSYEDFQAYLRKLKDEQETEIHWPAIDIEAVDAQDHSRNAGLQIADCLASSTSSGVEHNAYGNCERRYAEVLKPKIYSYNNNYLSYGMKIVPKLENAALSEEQKRFFELFK